MIIFLINTKQENKLKVNLKKTIKKPPLKVVLIVNRQFHIL